MDADSLSDPRVQGLSGTVTDRLTTALREDILAGVFPAGSRLKILDLARRYGLSPLPVREALARLEGERLVELAAHRGAAVRSLSAKLVHDIYDVRGALEALMAGRAAERRTAAELRELAVLQDRWEAAAATGEAQPMLLANLRLHARINAISDNPEAQELYTRGFNLIRVLRGRAGFTPSRIAAVREQHLALLEALRARDAEEARRISLVHGETARDDLLAQLQSAGLLAAEVPPPRLAGSRRRT